MTITTATSGIVGKNLPAPCELVRQTLIALDAGHPALCRQTRHTLRAELEREGGSR